MQLLSCLGKDAGIDIRQKFGQVKIKMATDGWEAEILESVSGGELLQADMIHLLH